VGKEAVLTDYFMSCEELIILPHHTIMFKQCPLKA